MRLFASRLFPGRLAGGRIGGSFAGISAIGAKELRGRMRGRRAFAFLTFYLTVLSGFVWMLQSLVSQSARGGAFESAQTGTTVFTGLLFLETLLVVFLAPAFTTGAISQEREKQTLDLLIATPISSFSIVIGKLFSALAWVFILVVASIPLTSIVFVYGGVAPEDLVRAYVVLIIDAIGLGCIGLFCSALLRRTLAATVASYFIVLALTLGSLFVWVFLYSTSTQVQQSNLDGSFNVTRKAPPEALLWFNPFVADADVLCPTGTGFNGFCSFVSEITGNTQQVNEVNQRFGPMPVIEGVAKPIPVQDGGVVVDPAVRVFAPDAPLAPPRDMFWPRSAAAWIGLSTILVLASVNLVSPTRRWRFNLRSLRGTRPDAS
jgi:ABC-type transport system involved in multi-copper enzyme maturation permease subunit